MENLEILKNIKDYMQWCIDRGYHKFTYNDLGWDFKCIDAINLIDDVLNHITKQEKMIDELKNGVHYQKCISCGKEIRVKRSDAKYCDECAKSKQKDYFKNMSNEKKKQRAEKSKMYMRELRARKKAKGGINGQEHIYKN